MRSFLGIVVLSCLGCAGSPPAAPEAADVGVVPAEQVMRLVIECDLGGEPEAFADEPPSLEHAVVRSAPSELEAELLELRGGFSFRCGGGSTEDGEWSGSRTVERLEARDACAVELLEALSARVLCWFAVDPRLGETPLTYSVRKPTPWREVVEGIAEALEARVVPGRCEGLLIYFDPKVTLEERQISLRRAVSLVAEAAGWTEPARFEAGFPNPLIDVDIEDRYGEDALTELLEDHAPGWSWSLFRERVEVERDE